MNALIGIDVRSSTSSDPLATFTVEITMRILKENVLTIDGFRYLNDLHFFSLLVSFHSSAPTAAGKDSRFNSKVIWNVGSLVK